ncbi:Tod6 protein [Saccharomycopsis crataegensis]|uniref:Tod6 protein n=1 Tax=Saccharomycopsis crataegensis TaxID=43959 RepID=A0AAV5QV64_9ASCO|nr:Tod6 protein [Saccharomycopsis crataegensis]
MAAASANNSTASTGTASTTNNSSFSRAPSSWDTQDDILLRHLKEEQKLGWKEIAAHFNNRTPNACQFRWRRLRSGVLKNTQTPTNQPLKRAINAAKAAAAASANNNKNNNNNGGTNDGLHGVLAGLNALSSGVRNGSPGLLVSSNSSPLQDSKNANGGTSLFASLMGNGTTTAKARLTTNPSSGLSAMNFGTNAPPNYTNWSFSSTGASSNSIASNSHNIGSPPDSNDPLSNSLSSLNSLDSATSNKNSFNLYSSQGATHAMSTNSMNFDPTVPGSAGNSFSQTLMSSSSQSLPWSHDEDELLLSKRRRELSLTELSILLPCRTEEDILGRIRLLDSQTRSQPRKGSATRNGSVITLYAGENDSHSDVTMRESRGSGINGYGLHTLSRTLSASSQISLNSNTSSFSYATNNNPIPTSAGGNNNNNSLRNNNEAACTTSKPSNFANSLTSNNSSPLPSSKSSPLLSSSQLPLHTMATGELTSINTANPSGIPSGNNTPLTMSGMMANNTSTNINTTNGISSNSVATSPPSIVGGGTSISSLRRTLSQPGSTTRSIKPQMLGKPSSGGPNPVISEVSVHDSSLSEDGVLTDSDEKR